MCIMDRDMVKYSCKWRPFSKMAAILHWAYFFLLENCFNGFFDPQNMGVDTNMKILCAIQAEIWSH